MGSVTGNNKVWRKFTFSAITTEKVRVLVNNALNSQSRLVEMEAWQGAESSSNGVDMQWMVSDQLGTPRMIADKSSSLAGIKRHDYLPFGEELLAGTGGRTAAQGYSGTDNVAQKFTGKCAIASRDWITSEQDITHQPKGDSRALTLLELNKNLSFDGERSRPRSSRARK